MVFNSLEFIVFLSAVFTLFYILPKKTRWVLLLVSSYFFYMYWNWKLVFLILFTSLVSYVSAILIDKSERQGAKKLVLGTALILCFGVLLVFKYLPFLSDVYFDIISQFKTGVIRGHFSCILPVGISFYTFQTSSYVIDVYRGKIQAEKHFGFYALYVIFFPQLVAGPIERFDSLLPQLRSLEDVHISGIDFKSAARFILLGYFKKIAVADIIGISVNAVYENVSSANGFTGLLASLLFAVQIFCDFSGYCDIAVGCGKLFGVNLTENFLSPYKSKSIKEFWNRWHITLSSWLKDYIYIPLGGSRVGAFRWILNIIIVFFVSGLWHGANYTYIVWGLMHGIMQIIGQKTEGGRNRLLESVGLKPEGKFVSFLRIVKTFILVDFCWIFFRANTISDASLLITKIFSEWSLDASFYIKSLAEMGLNLFSGIYIAVVILLLPFLEKEKGEIKSKFFGSGLFQYILSIIMTFAVLFAWIYLQASDVGSSFIYFQF